MLKELAFHGPHDLEMSQELVKLSTVRQARGYYNDLQSGPAMGNFAREKRGHLQRNLTLTHVYESSLQQVRWIQLATDGWLNTKDALRDLQRYYQSLTPSSSVVAITFMLDTLHNKLSDEQQALFRDDAMDIDEAARDPRLRMIFLKSICQTAVYYKMSAAQYLTMVADQRIITAPERDHLFDTYGELIDTVDDGPMLQAVINLGKIEPAYRAIVLAGTTER